MASSSPVAHPTDYSPPSGLLVINDRKLAFDALLSLGAGLTTTGFYLTDYPATFACCLVLSLTLVIRRHWPFTSLLIATAAALTALAVYQGMFPAIGIVPILVYSYARWQDQRLARAGLVVALVGSVLGPLRWFASAVREPAQWAFVGMTTLACAGIVGGAYLIGRRRQESVQQREFRRRSEEEQQRLLLAEQQQRARAATIDERNRIARELHDIVAHSLSVIVVQAEGAKALASKRPERAPEVLETIAETSREALTEMRRMVGLLRSGNSAEIGTGSGQQSEDYVPTPGLSDLPDLVRKTTDRAELIEHGNPPPVSQALGLTVYRIVQESLTNVLKHAGPTARAHVVVSYSDRWIEAEITDDGRGAAARGDGLGHGLQGMQERVAVHDGLLTARPQPGRGFGVRAVLPLDGQPPTTGTRPPMSIPQPQPQPHRPQPQHTFNTRGEPT